MRALFLRSYHLMAKGNAILMLKIGRSTLIPASLSNAVCPNYLSTTTIESTRHTKADLFYCERSHKLICTKRDKSLFLLGSAFIDCVTQLKKKPKPCIYYAVTKHDGHLRTRGKWRKQYSQASIFYISRVFSNFRSVLSQCTRLRLLHLLYDIEFY